MKHWIGLISLLIIACGGTQAEHGDHAAQHASAQAQNGDHASGHPGAAAHPGHGGEGHHGPGMHHDFSDVARFAAMFDDPERDQWQRPGEVTSLLELSAGSVVADLGAGTGYFEPHLSRAVGDSGRVLALDVEPAMVAHMRERFSQAGLANAEVRVVDGDDPGLEPSTIDRVLIVDTWHHIDDRPVYAAKLARALRPGGFVLIVDFTQDAPHGPPPAMRLSPAEVVAELNEGGLVARALPDETLPYQYVIRADLP